MITTSVAGCSGGGAGPSDDTETNQPTDGTAAATPTSTAATGTTDTEATDSETTDEDGQSIEEFLSDTGNFQSIVDKSGSDSAGVEVGVEGNVSYYAFDPLAIRVDTGTTVTWTWTGKGGAHNVVAVEGASFESELTSEEGFTFEHTFDETGTVLYVCTPHRGTGMKGAVVVE